ncbi:hypothetical protein HDDEFOMN_HDDEFOMN_02400 [Staphylococcus aureus]|nr:hypothetical protein HDDEFOMN_HDDEFOMN_02400 [Staphylococcus aureus]
MEFKTIQSVKDPHYNEALKLYDTKLNLSLTEDKRIIKRSLRKQQNRKRLCLYRRLRKRCCCQSSNCTL